MRPRFTVCPVVPRCFGGKRAEDFPALLTFEADTSSADRGALRACAGSGAESGYRGAPNRPELKILFVYIRHAK